MGLVGRGGLKKIVAGGRCVPNIEKIGGRNVWTVVEPGVEGSVHCCCCCGCTPLGTNCHKKLSSLTIKVVLRVLTVDRS